MRMIDLSLWQRLRLRLWQLQTFFATNSLDFLVVYRPARNTQQLRNLTIPIPPIYLGKSDDVMHERIFIPLFSLIRHG